jgi:hypothetical protein
MSSASSVCDLRLEGVATQVRLPAFSVHFFATLKNSPAARPAFGRGRTQVAALRAGARLPPPHQTVGWGRLFPLGRKFLAGPLRPSLALRVAAAERLAPGCAGSPNPPSRYLITAFNRGDALCLASDHATFRFRHSRRLRSGRCAEARFCRHSRAVLDAQTGAARDAPAVTSECQQKINSRRRARLCLLSLVRV